MPPFLEWQSPCRSRILAPIRTGWTFLRVRESLGTLRPGALRQGGCFDSRSRQRSGQLLPPVGDISGRSINVDHPARMIGNVGELVKDARRDVGRLAGLEDAALFSQAHLGGAFENPIHLFLFLIVPGDLPTVGLESHVPNGEVDTLDRAQTADYILGTAASGICAAADLLEIEDDHGCQMVSAVVWSGPSVPRNPLSYSFSIFTQGPI